jgi:hypothetical protein
VTLLRDGTYTMRVEYSSEEGSDSAEKTVKVGRPAYRVATRAVHADGSAAAGTRICIDGKCARADSFGSAAFELEEERRAVRAEAEYDVPSTRIGYSGERDIYISGDASIDVELRPERCVYALTRSVNLAEVDRSPLRSARRHAPPPKRPCSRSTLTGSARVCAGSAAEYLRAAERAPRVQESPGKG